MGREELLRLELLLKRFEVGGSGMERELVGEEREIWVRRDASSSKSKVAWKSARFLLRVPPL